MNASAAILLYTSKTNKDGTHPVCLRIIFNRTPKYISIANVKKGDWDADLKLVKSSHKNYKDINRDIKTKDAEAEDLILDFNRGKSRFSAEQIVSKLRGKKTAETFFDVLCDYVEEYKAAKKFDEASSIESKGKNIWSFVNGNKSFPVKSTNELKFGKDSILRLRTGKELAFTDVTPSFLRKLETFLEIEKGLNIRYVFNHMNMSKTIFNRGCEAQIVEKDQNPFEEYTLSRPKSQKVGLEKDEVERLAKLKLESKTDTWIHAKHAWLFAFAFAGQRISDALTVQWSSFPNGKINYIMRKNNKPVELPIPKRAQEILDYYLPFKTQNKGYVFPALRNADLRDPIDVKRKLKTAVRQYNIWLKKLAKKANIDKKLTTHLSRHTFGKLAGSKIPMGLLQIYYNHADIQTTSGYQQDFINQEQLDENLPLIVDF